MWLGHLNKFTSEDELKAELEQYGKVDSINVSQEITVAKTYELNTVNK